MKNDLILLNKIDLRSIGCSEYLIKEICRGLDCIPSKGDTKGYNQLALREAINNKLSQRNIKPQTRENLQILLKIIDNNSNLIEVDFLAKLSLEERIIFWKNYREKLRKKGDEILQDVDKLLAQAKASV